MRWGDRTNDVVLTLDAAAHRHHAGREDSAPVDLEHLDLDDEIGDACLVVKCEEHDALGAARMLAQRTMSVASSQRPLRVKMFSAQVTMRRCRRSSRRNDNGCALSVSPTWP